jgi:hypothetical protein
VSYASIGDELLELSRTKISDRMSNLDRSMTEACVKLATTFPFKNDVANVPTRHYCYNSRLEEFNKAKICRMDTVGDGGKQQRMNE